MTSLPLYRQALDWDKFSSRSTHSNGLRLCGPLAHGMAPAGACPVRGTLRRDAITALGYRAPGCATA
jgi:hypothetical protein